MALAHGLLSIAILLIIPFAVLVLDVAPGVFGGRLTSGSMTELTLVFGPVVALTGWLVAAYAATRGSVGPATVPEEPSMQEAEPGTVDT